MPNPWKKRSSVGMIKLEESTAAVGKKRDRKPAGTGWGKWSFQGPT